MKNKREFFIAIVFLLIGAMASFVIVHHVLVTNEKRYTQFANTYLQLSKVNNELIDVSNASFAEIVKCMTNEHCDTKESIKTFEEINKGTTALRNEKQQLANKIEQMSQK